VALAGGVVDVTFFNLTFDSGLPQSLAATLD
jgi:hypothetical protein